MKPRVGGASWADDGVRRQTLFFPSGEDRLYGSLYMAHRARSGIVICPSWGFDAGFTNDLCHRLARLAAELGGAALVYHPPGHGDSTGDLEDVGMENLVCAARDAELAASAAAPDADWSFAGVRLGAHVAALADEGRDSDRLLLIQPSFDAAAFTEQLFAAARRQAAVSSRDSRGVFGHPLPELLRATADDDRLLHALQGFRGHGVAVRFRSPVGDPLPARFAETILDGTWRWGADRDRQLLAAVAPYLRATMGAAA
jgi:hypothetical protein